MSIPEKFVCIIPARYQSSRFPGKPLTKILDKTMIDWIYENATAAKLTSDVIIATDSEEIEKYCKDNGIKVQMTGEHRNGSERVAEVAKEYPDEYVFEMQGDQPLLTAEQIDDFLSRSRELVLQNADIDVVHPYTEASDEQVQNPDVVKAFASASGRLLFQSRAPIPTNTRTLGLYLWKNPSLQKFWSLEKSPTEIIEDTHPVRLYYNDFYVQGLPFEGKDWVEVDRPHQVAEVEAILIARDIEGKK